MIYIIIMNPNNSGNYYMDTGDENVTYIPVKIKSNSNVFDDTDIIMKEVRFEQNAPPVYYAYKCMPIQYPLTLKGTQYETNSNLAPLPKTLSPTQLHSNKELIEYDARVMTTPTIVSSPQILTTGSSTTTNKNNNQRRDNLVDNRINDAQANVLRNNLI